jgi:putative DNA primase/helicase
MEESMNDWFPDLESSAEQGACTGEPTVDKIAAAITGRYYFAKDAGERLYVCLGGVYRPSGDSVIRKCVKELLVEWGLPAKWSTRKAAEAIEYIRVDAPELWDTPPADTINVLNGLLDVKTKTIRAHDPEFLSAVQLPVRFDPSAPCPAWDKFINEVFPEDSKAIAWEIPAWLMTSENSIQKAILLLGEGSNGKSVYLRALVTFLGGRSNTTSLSLHKLEQDKFAAARLLGKLANVCPDLPTSHLTGTSMFKALTGGDLLTAEYKFCDSFEFQPFCKLVFSANAAPHSDDATHGFFRRWQVIPFLRNFEEGAAGTMRREDLDARLADPDELSGVLNKALIALQQVRKGSFTQSESMREAMNDFKTATDPLSVWLDKNTVMLPTASVPKHDLMAAFNKHLVDSGKAPMTNMAFGLAVRRARPGLEDKQRIIRGRLQWAYLGIGLRTEDLRGENQEEAG